MVEEIVALVIAEELLEQEGAWRPRHLLNHTPPLLLHKQVTRRSCLPLDQRFDIEPYALNQACASFFSRFLHVLQDTFSTPTWPGVSMFSQRRWRTELLQIGGAASALSQCQCCSPVQPWSRLRVCHASLEEHLQLCLMRHTGKSTPGLMTARSDGFSIEVNAAATQLNLDSQA